MSAHSVPWFERHLLRPGQKVSWAASKGTVTLLLVHKARKGTTRKVKAVDRKPGLSAPIWLGSCCQLLPCSRVLREVIAFVLPSSLLQASPLSVAFVLLSLKQAQCFAKLRTYLLNAAATLLRNKACSWRAHSASAASALPYLTGGERWPWKGRDAVAAMCLSKAPQGGSVPSVPTTCATLIHLCHHFNHVQTPTATAALSSTSSPTYCTTT